MQPDDDALLLDIVIAGRKIATFVEGLSYDQLLDNEPMQFGLVKLIEIVGEAANHLTDARRSSLSNIPWSDIITMRHVLVHDYSRIDLEVVWKTVVRDMPQLLAMLEPLILPEHPEDRSGA